MAAVVGKDDRGNSMALRDTKANIDDFFPKMKWNKGKERVLDIGTGSGKVLKKLVLPWLGEKDKVVGTDISERMIEYAEKHSSDPRITYREFDILAPNPRQEFPEGFTKIVSFQAMHFILDPKTMFRNLYNLLEPGGELMTNQISNFCLWQAINLISNIEEYHYTLLRNVTDKMTWTYLSEDAEGDARIMLEEVGFEVLSCELERKSYTFESIEHFEETTRTMNPFETHIGERGAGRERFVGLLIKVASAIDERLYDRPQPSWGYEMLVIHARKPK